MLSNTLTMRLNTLRQLFSTSTSLSARTFAAYGKAEPIRFGQSHPRRQQQTRAEQDNQSDDEGAGDDVESLRGMIQGKRRGGDYQQRREGGGDRGHRGEMFSGRDRGRSYEGGRGGDRQQFDRSGGS